MDPTPCRLTGAPLDVVLDLGKQPLGNGFRSVESPSDEYFFDLRCGFNEQSRLFQLIEQPNPELMFHEDYAFFSGTSRRMAEHFAEFALNVQAKGFVPSKDSFVVELGSNDGIFLSNFAAAGVRHLGVEPSGRVADVAELKGISVLREFFNTAVARQIRDEHGGADLVAAANVMCHIPDIGELAQGIELLLKDEGVLVFEDPYLGDVVRLTSYDQIYDEHVFLFSGLSVQRIFESVDMELIDLEPQTTHGGSMRYTLAKRGRRAVNPRVQKLLDEEISSGLHLTETFHSFAERVRQSAEDLHSALKKLKTEGKKVSAYGATSKSTTIYNYADIGPDLIDYICDNTPIKIDKVSPGMHIPIVAESKFQQSPPEVAFLAAWNHSREIRQNNNAFENGGGRWLTHVPQVHFLG